MKPYTLLHAVLTKHSHVTQWFASGASYGPLRVRRRLSILSATSIPARRPCIPVKAARVNAVNGVATCAQDRGGVPAQVFKGRGVVRLPCHPASLPPGLCTGAANKGGLHIRFSAMTVTGFTHYRRNSNTVFGTVPEIYA